MTQAASISTVDFLLSQRHTLSLMCTSRSDASQSCFAHTTFGDLPGLLLVLVDQSTSRCPDTKVIRHGLKNVKLVKVYACSPVNN